MFAVKRMSARNLVTPLMHWIPLQVSPTALRGGRQEEQVHATVLHLSRSFSFSVDMLSNPEITTLWLYYAGNLETRACPVKERFCTENLYRHLWLKQTIVSHIIWSKCWFLSLKKATDLFLKCRWLRVALVPEAFSPSGGISMTSSKGFWICLTSCFTIPMTAG